MPYAVMAPSGYYKNPSLLYGGMLPGQDRGAMVPGWGMSPYWAGPSMVGVGAYGADPTTMKPMPSWVIPVAAGAVILLVGAAIYTNYKVASKIAEKEGSAGLLKYELGTAAIGAGARAVDRLMGDDAAYRRNRRRRLRRRGRKSR